MSFYVSYDNANIIDRSRLSAESERDVSTAGTFEPTTTPP